MGLRVSLGMNPVARESERIHTTWGVGGWLNKMLVVIIVLQMKVFET